METPDDFNSQTPDETTPSLPASPSPRLGIASFVLSSIGVILYCLPYGLGVIVGLSGIPLTIERSSPVNVLGWFVSWCGSFMGFIALALGSVSVSREEKKTFGIIGIVLGLLLTCSCLASIAFNISQIQ